MSGTTWPPLSLTSTMRVTLQSNARKPFLSTTRDSVLLQRKLAKGREASSQARKSKCTSECKLPTSEEQKRIVALKLQFDESSIPALRRALDEVDTGCPHLHASTPFTRKHKGKREYNSDQCRELKGHPLPCAQVDSECLSEVVVSCCLTLRGCAEASVYRAIRLHVVVNSIDMFEVLCNLLDITDYAELLRASNQSADNYRSDDSSDAQLPVLQKPGLLDVESYLHVQHAELIQEFEKSLEI